MGGHLLILAVKLFALIVLLGQHVLGDDERFLQTADFIFRVDVDLEGNQISSNDHWSRIAHRGQLTLVTKSQMSSKSSGDGFKSYLSKSSSRFELIFSSGSYHGLSIFVKISLQLSRWAAMLVG